MSQGPRQDPPPSGSGPEQARSARQGRGSVILGTVVGTVALGVGVWALLAIGLPEAGTIVSVSGFVYFFTALAFTLRDRTTRFGAGLLLAIGVWLLVGAGVCFTFVANVGRGG